MKSINNILRDYLKETNATSKDLIYREEIKNAMRCGNKTVDRYLEYLDPVRSGTRNYYLVEDVANAIRRVEGER